MSKHLKRASMKALAFTFALIMAFVTLPGLSLHTANVSPVSPELEYVTLRPVMADDFLNVKQQLEETLEARMPALPVRAVWVEGLANDNGRLLVAVRLSGQGILHPSFTGQTPRLVRTQMLNGTPVSEWRYWYDVGPIMAGTFTFSVTAHSHNPLHASAFGSATFSLRLVGSEWQVAWH